MSGATLVAAQTACRGGWDRFESGDCWVDNQQRGMSFLEEVVGDTCGHEQQRGSLSRRAGPGGNLGFSLHKVMKFHWEYKAIKGVNYRHRNGFQTKWQRQVLSGRRERRWRRAQKRISRRQAVGNPRDPIRVNHRLRKFGLRAEGDWLWILGTW